MRLYGKVTTGTGYWTIECEPQVVIKLKRVFPKITSERARVLRLSINPENGLELDWFLQRYPMELDDKTIKTIAANKTEFENTREKVMEILSGKTVLHTDRTPIREPRPYQQIAADLAYTTGTLLLTDSLGLGKTASSLMVLAHNDTLPALVVCPPGLVNQWVTETNRVFDDMETHIIQRGKPYDIIKEENLLRKRAAKRSKTDFIPLERNPDILLISYNKLSGWLPYLSENIKTVIFDEVQELRRPESQKSRAAAMLTQSTGWAVGLSGTPVANFAKEVYYLMSAMSGGNNNNPLGTDREFTNEHVASGYYGSKPKLKDPAALALHMVDLGVLLRRTRDEVGLPLDEPLRSVIRVEADLDVLKEHTAAAKEMAELILSESTSPKDRWQLAGDFEMKLRQATAIAKTPYTAAAIDGLLQDSEENLVVFAYHRGVYDILNERLAKYSPAMYTGTESPAKKQQELQRFLDRESRILMISWKSAAGLDGLQYVTSCGVSAEHPWTPLDIEQGMGRILRTGQEHVVSWVTMSTDVGTDPFMEETLGIKTDELQKFNNPMGVKTLFESTRVSDSRAKDLARFWLEHNS